ncbi:hypothetical protein, partial [Aeromonas caviae]|uniref:hypothetical protein n=1 Tax=Aeromonas caviae TaxID=648 RepID=UPI00375458EC
SCRQGSDGAGDQDLIKRQCFLRKNKPRQRGKNEHDPAHIIVVTGSGKVTFYFVRINATL